MIRTYTDEIRNETFYYDTKRRQWVEPEEIIYDPEVDDDLPMQYECEEDE